MKILSYKYTSTDKTDLTFSEVDFQNLNLIVGITGAGKSRFLNSIFYAGFMAVNKKLRVIGHWDITIEQGAEKYRWVLDIGRDEEKQYVVAGETIELLKKGSTKKIVDRTEDSFIFNGDKLPKLSREETSIVLLKDEDAIKPLYQGFSSIIRQQFSGDALEKTTSFRDIQLKLLQKIKNEKDLALIPYDMPLNNKLYFLSECFEDKYTQICEEFKAVFPFVSELKLSTLQELHKDFLRGLESFPLPIKMGNVPVFALKENHGDKWIPLDQWASGMQKVLLLITEILLLTEDGWVYLIDEYENSLGVNAINFLPEFLLEYGKKHQIFITSHHPYIINKIPVENWFLLHRTGSEVTIESGQKLKERYAQSHQESFIQLINDPLYDEGVA